jgi:hypothetical protein
MKGWYTIAVLVFVLGAFPPGNLSAEKEWKQALISDGWKKLELRRMDFANTTWYVQSGPPGTEHFVKYHTPDGKTAYFRTRPDRAPSEGTWEPSGDGTYCVQFMTLVHGVKRCNRTLWRKGELYLAVNHKGLTSGLLWVIKRGNLENF